MRSLMTILAISLLAACQNRDINEGEEFKPREVSEDFGNFHFNRIVYDGVEYLITERDNNNPHEGFGFMAFRANELIEEQDSLMAHLKAIGDMQARIYAQLYGVSGDQADSLYQAIFSYYLAQEQTEVSSQPAEAPSEETTAE